MQAAAGTPLNAQQHTSDDGTEATTRPRRGLFWAVLALAAVWVGLDQLVKAWAEATLTPGEPVPVVGELFQLRLVYNPGAAFSMATNATALLTVLATAVSAYIVWSARRLGSRGWALGLGLLLGGAVGNLVDRLVRAPGPGRGHVVDLFALPNFPVFNVADIGISCAAVVIALLALRGISPDGTRAGQHREDDSS
ncbi:signal peptidase II [Ornithinicoccus halotolerans]|uniref:signal peptidase II n=1 Tax=Ornithinicoccus halotolerans TaxID=1748220 RepID=UPI0012955B04|nr:signal peptidase II [Ornithinicoccus halotolerans]